jgi:hypothetical protein
MTKHELIDAYVRGRIDRRNFVRRLTALGVSASAAGAYALSLSPSASAAGTRTAAGYRVRAQDEYGGAADIILALFNILKVAGLLTAFEHILAHLRRKGRTSTVANLKAAPHRFQVSDADSDELATLFSQAAAHADAIKSLLTDLGSSAPSPSVPTLTYDSIDELVTDLQPVLEVTAGYYAWLIPTTADKKTLATLASIGLVASRHAAFVNRLVGQPSFPETFNHTNTSDEVTKTVDGLSS